MHSETHYLMQIRPTPICFHFLVTVMIYMNNISEIKPRVAFQQCFSPLRSSFWPWASYLTGSNARKRGHVLAAFALLHFNDWVHCCHQKRKPPASGNANACHWDANTLGHAHTHKQANVHIIIPNIHTQWQWNAAQTNRQISTHTTHTQLLLRHSKEEHNQTRCVQ